MFVDVRLKPRSGAIGSHDAQAFGVADKPRLVRLHAANVSHGVHDVLLRPESLKIYDVAGGGPAFPTQYFGLKAYYGGSVRDLCLVAEADAPSGMGGVLKVRKSAGTFAVYLVETGDGNASTIRVRTSTGTKAIRLKT